MDSERPPLSADLVAAGIEPRPKPTAPANSEQRGQLASPDPQGTKAVQKREKSPAATKKFSATTLGKRIAVAGGILSGVFGGVNYFFSRPPSSETELKERIRETDTKAADNIRLTFGLDRPPGTGDTAGQPAAGADDIWGTPDPEVTKFEEEERAAEKEKLVESARNKLIDTIKTNFPDVLTVDCEGEKCSIVMKATPLTNNEDYDFIKVFIGDDRRMRLDGPIGDRIQSAATTENPYNFDVIPGDGGHRVIAPGTDLMVLVEKVRDALAFQRDYIRANDQLLAFQVERSAQETGEENQN